MEIANKLLQMVGMANSERSYAWVDAAVMTIITAISVYHGEATIFYIIYLFWCNELVILLIGWFFDKIYKRKSTSNTSLHTSGRLFFLAIYWVFIFVFFGLIANWDNTQIMMVNFSILLFQNVFFLANIGFFILEQIKYNIQHKTEAQEISMLTPNMVVLHISIILGAVLMFFVIKRYPETFTPSNLWASVIIIIPFLILRFVVRITYAKDKS